MSQCLQFLLKQSTGILIPFAQSFLQLPDFLGHFSHSALELQVLLINLEKVVIVHLADREGLFLGVLHRITGRRSNFDDVVRLAFVDGLLDEAVTIVHIKYI